METTKYQPLELSVTLNDLPQLDDKGRIICPMCHRGVPKYTRERTRNLHRLAKEIRESFDENN